MALFLVQIRYVQEKFREVGPRHRDYVVDLVSGGVCKVAGPLTDGTGAMLIFEAGDEAELTKILDADPYHLEGALEERTVSEFRPVLGSWIS